MKYDGRMDAKCIELCDTLNSLPGIRTSESCCGHGRESFDIWLYVESMQHLVILGRVLDRRYGCPEGWTLVVDNTDQPENCPIFWLTSGPVKGEQAYKDAKKLVESIKRHLNHENFVKAFNIPLPKYEKNKRN